MKNTCLTSRRTDLKVLIILGLVGVSLIAATLVQSWALSVYDTSGDFFMSSPNETGADIVRQYWPHRLVQPEWVSRKPDWLENWGHAEATVRCVVVVAGWFIVSGAFFFIYIKFRNTLPNSANGMDAFGFRQERQICLAF